MRLKIAYTEAANEPLAGSQLSFGLSTQILPSAHRMPAMPPQKSPAKRQW